MLVILGYEMNRKTGFCQDINECSNFLMNKCMGLSKCFNLPGSFECQCSQGFKGEFCTVDIDECENKEDKERLKVDVIILKSGTYRYCGVHL